MIAALDVHYREQDAVAACVMFREWGDAAPALELVEVCPSAEAYYPGELYRRELPCLLQCLQRLEVESTAALQTVIVDGFVWLDEGEPALGGHLFQALGERVAVIGVAKNPFARAGAFVEVLRGESKRPLFVSAAGVDLAVAAEQIRSMHGAFRIPTLLRRVDQLCRRGLQPAGDPSREGD